eukprot:GHVO01057576.1.p2 GENE.GHVO01057576.1~~GHVO01057576.1.p2  ORF type:complete len:118 (-),score=8.85 GHVO01057576.1:17-370(-)
MPVMREPSGKYGSMPKLFEVHALRGAASLYGFEAEHLQWALDFDRRFNPHPDPDPVKKNSVVRRMTNYHRSMNEEDFAILSKLTGLSLRPKTVRRHIDPAVYEEPTVHKRLGDDGIV